MDWPSGLGGVGGRGRARLTVANPRPDKKMIFFGAGRGGSLVGGDRGGSWGEGVVRSRAQGGGVVGVREREKSSNFECFWGREGGVPGRWRQRPGMDWPSGLGGVGGRGRASTHGAFSWVDGYKSYKKN